jgi:hypothetical protein
MPPSSNEVGWKVLGLLSSNLEQLINEMMRKYFLQKVTKITKGWNNPAIALHLPKFA